MPPRSIPKTRRCKTQVKRNVVGHYFARRQAPNGRILAHTEGYHKLGDCAKALVLLGWQDNLDNRHLEHKEVVSLQIFVSRYDGRETNKTNKALEKEAGQ